MPVRKVKVKSPASRQGGQKSKVQRKTARGPINGAEVGTQNVFGSQLKSVTKASGASANTKNFGASPRQSDTTRLSATLRAQRSLTVDVYNTKGKAVGKIALPKEIFAAKINPKLMAQAVRVYLANQRKGTVSTKTRGEVKGSTRKIYRQKGTGRARMGSIRSPIRVHGGLAHGPKPRDYGLLLPKKMKRKALFSALSQKLKDNEIKIVKGLEKIEPKTKLMAQVINNLKLNSHAKSILLVLPSAPRKIETVYRASRNIEGLKMIEAALLNTYEVIKSKIVLFMEPSIEKITGSFERTEESN